MQREEQADLKAQDDYANDDDSPSEVLEKVKQ
jgi:hypothetical protein